MPFPFDPMLIEEAARIDQMHGRTADALALSQAISLKRIADALTGETANIFTASINSYGEGIGDAIQGQMIRGARGIDQYEGR